VGGIKVTCEQVNRALMAQFKMDDTFSAITCSTETTGCACKATLKPRSNKETGKYSTSGTTLSMTDASGDIEANDYCVGGSTLRTKPSKMMGMDDFTGTIVAKRK
jgi:hypothetical protein